MARMILLSNVTWKGKPYLVGQEIECDEAECAALERPLLPFAPDGLAKRVEPPVVDRPAAYSEDYEPTADVSAGFLRHKPAKRRGGKKE